MYTMYLYAWIPEIESKTIAIDGLNSPPKNDFGACAFSEYQEHHFHSYRLPSFCPVAHFLTGRPN